MPDQVRAFMAIKHVQIEHEGLRRLYLDVGDLADCARNDPRLPVLAGRVCAFLDAAAAESADMEEDQPVPDDLVALLDALFIEFFPCAPRLLELLEERGYTGWTNIRRTDSATQQRDDGSGQPAAGPS